MTRGAIIDYCRDKISGFKERPSGAQLSWLKRFIKRHELQGYIAAYNFSAEATVHVEAPSQDSGVVADSPIKTPQVQSPSPPPLDPTTEVDAPASPPPAMISLVDDTEEGVDSGNECDENLEVEVADIVCETQTLNFAPGKTSVRLVVQKSDLGTLECQNWLNDVVITYYIRYHIPSYGRTYIMDANLFALVFAKFKASGRKMKSAYKSCRGITTSFPYDKYDCVIIPVSMGNHWTFAVVQNPVLAVDNLRRCIVQVDSL
ncbi:hypothetical protein ON010_g994 [Phytophthora cinnamomi]|nr:hypothetical protein ON010_g994 [Phytophthora cinnamomi]